jgi:hypothetical protein
MTAILRSFTTSLLTKLDHNEIDTTVDTAVYDTCYQQISSGFALSIEKACVAPTHGSGWIVLCCVYQLMPSFRVYAQPVCLLSADLESTVV